MKYAQIIAQIEQAIADGELAPGDRLPPERALAEEHGVSRMTVRQAPGRLPDRRHRLRRVDHELQRRRRRHYYLGSRVRELMATLVTRPGPVMPEGFPAYIAEGLLDHLVGR